MVGFLASPAAVQRPVPALGAHNAKLAREAGYWPAEIEELTAGGVLGAAPSAARAGATLRARHDPV